MAKSSKKIKTSKAEISSKDICKKCYQPKFIKFNFTFLHKKSYKKLNPNELAEVYSRIISVSQFPTITLINMGKREGFETISKKQIKLKKASKPYEKDNDHLFNFGHRKIKGKCMVLRIDTNGISRFIGELINSVYYIYYIDFEGKAYDHGS